MDPVLNQPVVPTTPDPSDDATAELTRRRESMAGSAAVNRLEAEFGEGATPTQPKDPATDPAAKPAEADDEGGLNPGMSVLGRAIADFSRGMTEAPGQVVKGVRDAAQETIDMWISAGNWMEKKFPITPGKDAGTAEAPQLPDPIGEADSNTGKMVKSISQFLAGFVGAGKMKVFQAIAPATRTGKTLKAMGQGAVADFTVMDPHEKGLSDLVESVPALSNPVTRFLAADPDDNEAEKRFKKAAEGAGVGTMVDGLVMGVKALRAARIARAEARIDDPTIPIENTAEADLKAVMGDPTKPVFQTRKIDEAVEATEGLKPKDVGSTTAPETIEINFARIEGPEDIQKTIQQMADWYTTPIKDEQRGVRSWEQTRLSATQQNAWDDVMSRRTGETWNAEQTLAARQLWVTSATKLSEVARLAAQNPGSGNLVAFRQMLATHYAIQKEVLGARTETARALNAWKIPAGAEGDMARQIDMLLQSNGGGDTAKALAERIAVLSEAGMAKELEKVVEGGVLAKTRAAVSQVWINALLTNPATHSANIVSTFGMLGLQMAERRVAASISDALGTEGGVAVGEAMAMLNGALSGFKDSLRAAWKTAKTGQTEFGATKLDATAPDRPGALSSETWNVANDTAWGKSLDWIDAIVKAPGRALMTTDEFFKTNAYRTELHAQAHRVATSEVGEGAITQEQFGARVRELIDNPPENLRVEAMDMSMYATFTNQPRLAIAEIAQAWQQKIPVLGVLTMPFVRTPANLLYGAIERTPMAPLLKGWREDIAAGGARADIATARMATGSMLMLAMMDAAMSGNITGKGPERTQERQAWMREGNQEYSVRVGDRYFSFSRLDPVGMTVGMAADIAEAAMNADKKMEEGGSTYNAMEEAITAAIFAVAKNATSKTYMSGLAEFIDAISDPGKNAERWTQRVAGTAVPAGVAAGARQVDPYMRTAQTIVEAMQKRLPFWSEDLPMYRDLWGRPVDYRSGYGAMYDIFSPVYTKKYAPEPVDLEFKRLDFFPSMPEKKANFNGVGIDMEEHPHAYARLVELAGNELKHPAWGMGAKDMLNAVVNGEHPLSAVYKLYSDGKDGGKADFLKKIVSEYRDLAKKQVLEEFPALQAEYESKRKPYGNRLDPALFGQ